MAERKPRCSDFVCPLCGKHPQLLQRDIDDRLVVVCCKCNHGWHADGEEVKGE